MENQFRLAHSRVGGGSIWSRRQHLKSDGLLEGFLYSFNKVIAEPLHDASGAAFYPMRSA